MVLWIIEKIVMLANLDVFFMEMNLKAWKNDKLQKLCPHFCHMHLQRERLVLRILMQCHIAPFCQHAVRPYGSFREIHAGTVDVSGQAWLHRCREAIELPLLPPPLVTLTETSPCKGLSTLPALYLERPF